MSRQIQIRRGTKNQHASFTGAIGEVTMDTTNNTLRVHDGKTVGGNEMLSRNGFFSYVTNCITEIPQDIKLELTGGTLTLKAKSKAYRPNGSGVFDVITISSDKTLTNTTDGTYVVCVTSGGGMIQRDISRCVSGATRPLTTTYMLWYDTTNNVINNYGSDSSTPAQTVSLPIAIITVSDGAISSIDQVFNGFGYIGTMLFVLPGVCCLIPNGRNQDGSFNNTIKQITQVRLSQLSSNATNLLLIISDFSKEYDNVASDRYYYDNASNYIFDRTSETTASFCIVGTIKVESNNINVNYKTVFSLNGTN